MPVVAAELTQRVRFYKRGAPSAEAAATGAPEGDWQEQFVVWAKVQHLRGSETVTQSRLEGRQPAIVTVRASAAVRAVDEGWRIDIRHGDDWRRYGITAVTPHGDRRGVDFMAVYGGPVG